MTTTEGVSPCLPRCVQTDYTPLTYMGVLDQEAVVYKENNGRNNGIRCLCLHEMASTGMKSAYR